ncbi:hypothetical protein DWB84_07285 [Saccharophagus sp. K07]|jgi:hypothetical protein|uniref:hypothetical protein n=1 Tax=Saccharophagus sp. K07 TaxID=2283636 RepID=UPI0016523C9E|nr:hypothetical protein [Saccharophagus sp. K07]MBC6905263.1 hypothetical protein [Saccharophagus sp. K07]
MARRKKAETQGIIAIVIIGGAIWAFQNYPAISIIMIVILVVGYFATKSPASCQLCNSALKRNSYIWQIEGQKKTVCPNCNRELERKNSKKAVSKI